jgi:hypothetical protein
VAAFLVAAAAISGVVYAHTYSPLGQGNYVTGQTGQLHALTDGVSDPTRLVLVGPPGSTGSIGFSIENNGHYPVRVLGAATDSFTALGSVMRLSWAPSLLGPNPQSVDNVSDARPFPVTVRPHQQITVFVTLTQPACATGESNQQIGALPLRTEALWVHHTWLLPLTLAGSDPELDYCSPNSALKHLSDEG